MMTEDGPGSQFFGQYGSGAIGMSIGGNKPQEEQTSRPQYSMPGILHFLQTEWARFEMERSQWEVERAELQARIAFLQGERKGQENLKQDLVRRIKMLEFALKQERAKYHKLKFGTELNQGEMKPPMLDEKDKEEPLDGDVLNAANSNVTWKQGRQLLRQYLQEIGYTDTIIDVRSARVRQLLGLQSNTDDESRQMVNGEPTGKRPSEAQGRRTAPKKIPTSMADSALLDTEASVIETFDFLASEPVVDEDDEENLSDEENNEGAVDEEAEERMEKRRAKKIQKKMIGNESMAGMEEALADPETEEALAEFDFLVSESGEGAGEARSSGDGTEWESGAGDRESQTRLEEDQDDDDEDEDGEDWEKKDLSPSEEWGVDQQLISKLKEEYKKERQKGKRGMQRPKRSTLQAMLANLGSEEELPALQTGSASPPRQSPNNNNELDEDSRQVNGIPGDEDPLSAALGLGELASLSVSNEEEPLSYDKGAHKMIGVPGEEDALEAVLGLGDLAGLTINNEADPLSYDISATKEAFRKTWNAKYTLRSHFDGVRSLAFHPVEPVLITASEDHTLKLWNLQKTVPAKKATSLDVEPVYTFRAHTAPVLCLSVSPTGETCYSGGADSTIRCWNIPNSNIDPYDLFDPSVLQDTLVAHTDAVWGLSIHSAKMQLLSCSADATVRLWSPGSKCPLLNTFRVETEEGLPTSVDFVRCEPTQMIAAYSSSNAYIFDMESAKTVLTLESNQNGDSASCSPINRIVSHPTLPVTITAHEDRHIRFFDNNSGKIIHSMVAHLDAVTSLAVDPNGLYLLSGSHDCSIRLWNLDSKTCVQEITSHRKKFDESIHDVAFHPSKPYIASAGADALAKVFV